MKINNLIVIDLALVAASVLILIGAFVYFEGKQISFSPLEDVESSVVLFRFENVKQILVDDNLEFKSPVEYVARNGLIISLKPGVYYWKLQGDRFSEIRRVETDTEVSFMLKELADGSYWVVNAGGTTLNVEKYKPDGSYDESFSLTGGSNE
jgi:hypothetical protein